MPRFINMLKIRSKQKLLAYLFFLLVIGFAIFSQLITADPKVQSIPVPSVISRPVAYNQKTSKVGAPVRLKIPVINVDAAIESVGVTAGGNMETPKTPSGVAWYENGPRPGDNGSAVIDGHYNWENNLPAVFYNLYQIHSGDVIYVLDASGVTRAFVVKESQSYDRLANTSSIFLSSDGKAHLNLITCEGVWNKVQKSYSSRLVVFADMQ